jgi:hypothetical protein
MTSVLAYASQYFRSKKLVMRAAAPEILRAVQLIRLKRRFWHLAAPRPLWPGIPYVIHFDQTFEGLRLSHHRPRRVAAFGNRGPALPPVTGKKRAMTLFKRHHQTPILLTARLARIAGRQCGSLASPQRGLILISAPGNVRCAIFRKRAVMNFN